MRLINVFIFRTCLNFLAVQSALTYCLWIGYVSSVVIIGLGTYYYIEYDAFGFWRQYFIVTNYPFIYLCITRKTDDLGTNTALTDCLQAVLYSELSMIRPSSGSSVAYSIILCPLLLKPSCSVCELDSHCIYNEDKSNIVSEEYLLLRI